MYRPAHFVEDRVATLHDLIRTHPLGLLISVGADGPVADPVPFLLDATPPPFGTLRAHVARANPHWRGLTGGQDALVVFQGVGGYITPSWYETKRVTGKVVPTWNYAIVQARGPVRVIEDRDWLHAQVEALTTVHEAARPKPWAVDDAPAPFVHAQLGGIIGLEIRVTRLSGKWKMSQNRPVADRQGVAAGLAEDAAAMSALVRDYAGLD